MYIYGLIAYYSMNKSKVEWTKNMLKMTNIESLKGQIEYMRELGCDKLANLLVEDLENETLKEVTDKGYVATDYSQEARDRARAKYGRKY